MEQFSLEKYLENPSRKVCTRNGRNVKIVCTDAPNQIPYIYGFIETSTGMESWKKDGMWAAKESCNDLFFADEEETNKILDELKSYLKNTPKEQVEKDWKEIQDWYNHHFTNEEHNEKEGLTEFEKKFIDLIRFWMSGNTNPEENLIQSRFDAKELLDLARKELQPEINKEIDKAYKNIDTIVYDNGYKQGQYEIMEDLPKWKKAEKDEELDCHVAIQQDDRVVLSDFVQKDEYYITLNVLKKLPKEE